MFWSSVWIRTTFGRGGVTLEKFGQDEALRAMKEAGTLAQADIRIVLSGDEESAGRPVALARHDMIEAGRWADAALEFEGLARADGKDVGSISRRGSITWTLTAHEALVAADRCYFCYDAPCTTACPTGIDIRKGLQIECIACAACIDVCDDVMDKMGSPRGLIRYTTQHALDHQATHICRPRVIIYGARLLARVRADQQRDDLRGAGKGDGRHGFVLPTPPDRGEGSNSGGRSPLRARDDEQVRHDAPHEPKDPP